MRPIPLGSDPCAAVLTEVGTALTTAAERLHIPFAGDARSIVRRGEVRAHPVWQEPPLADGLPVVLVGGLLTATPVLLSVLREWLTRLGCRTLIAPTGLGVGCGEMSTRIVAQTLADFADATGAAPVVIGYSRGGQFARAAAARHPDLVGGLITLGSPLRGELAEVHPLLRLQIYALGAMGTLGVPRLLSARCLWGSCCQQLREDLDGPFPEQIPFLSVYSRTDEMVGWRSSLDPAARYHEVSTSHGGLVADPAVFSAVAAELREVITGAVAGGPDDTVTAA
jgi:pimeloyl-ACP methyl ester carboxylesterase